MSEGGGRPGAYPASRPLGNLQLRVLSAFVLAVVALVPTWLGGWPFRLLTVLVAGAVLHEWMAMLRPVPGRAQVALAWVFLSIVLVLLLGGWPAAVVFGVLALAVLASGILATVDRAGHWATAGLFYAAAPAAALAFVRDDDRAGLAGVAFLFAVVWATDIFAYFVGRRLGGPKLAPGISPGKTWSGAVGGTIAGVIGGVLVGLSAGSPRGVLAMAVFGGVLSVVSQGGDIFESAMKRRGGVKDSGRIIPGHGGVMDRVDGLVMAAFVFYVFGALLAGADTPARAFFLP